MATFFQSDKRSNAVVEYNRGTAKAGMFSLGKSLVGRRFGDACFVLEQDSTTAIPSGLIGPGGMGLSVQDILAVFVRDDDGA